MNSSGVQKRHRGVVVPMVTPLTMEATLDAAAVGRIVDHLVEAQIHGVFVLGTTGESRSVPPAMKNQLVDLVTARAKGRMRIYAGISSSSLDESVRSGNDYLKAGVDAVVAHAPNHSEPNASLDFFTGLAGRLEGDLIIYNIPLTTHVSLPIEVCKQTARRAGVIGIKDSENNAHRLGELLRELRGERSFSVFIGTGMLMAEGLFQGADGIVPSVGNLVPRLCRQFYDCVIQAKVSEAEFLHRKLMEIAGIYQKGRSLDQSLAALKGAMSWLGLCGPSVFPPLTPTDKAARLILRSELTRLGVPMRELHVGEPTVNHLPHDQRPAERGRALPADPC